MAPWSADTARVLPAGRVEIGVFAPLRVGLRERLEASLHPGWFFVAPHAQLKVAWAERGRLAVASRHGVLYPTPLMRLLSREGTGGIVPADVLYPHVISTAHHLLVSAGARGHVVTVRAGGRLATNLTAFDGPRFWSQVEWHLVWPRTAAWFTGWSADVGIGVEGPVAARVGYRLELDRFFMPGLRGDWAWEWAGVLSWRPSDRVQLRAGAKWSYAAFPYGSRLSVPLPVVDAAWAWDAGRR
jgi:hypothetical protein